MFLKNNRTSYSFPRYFRIFIKKHDSKYWKSYFYIQLLTGVSIGSYFAYVFYGKVKNKVELKDSPNKSFGAFRPDLPTFTLEEVSKHDTIKNKVWITYKQGVYDVTDFVPVHLGGDLILMAAGGAVDPFWLLHAAHKTPKVLNILEPMRIGNISLEDSEQSTRGLTDPYINDPIRSKTIVPMVMTPFNAGAPLSILVENYYTPNELFYVRNHFPVPVVDPTSYNLEVEVEDQNKSITLTLDEIRKMPKHTVIATLMCVGNRRNDMVKVKPISGMVWGANGVSNAKWTGAKLRDVLALVGITEDTLGDYKHVKFEAIDLDAIGGPYNTSIPIWMAVNKYSNIILAYEMNDDPLPPDHGYPIRLLIPGVVGARNVKWLERVEVTKEETKSFWQYRDNKGFPPGASLRTVEFDKSPAIQAVPVTSAICVPNESDNIKVVNGKVTVKGYAYSGGGNAIIRVDVTVDGGKNWHVATLQDEDVSEVPYHYGWTLWSIQIPVNKDCECVEIWSKAVDSNQNVQPDTTENIWNFMGLLSNAYHRVNVNLKW